MSIINNYSTIIFIDSMVVLEGRPLEEQPWTEIDANGSILLLFVPQVCKEIDKRKRDGRLGKHARAFNRLMTSAAESGSPQTIVEGTPRVDLGLAITNHIDWDNLDDFDPEEADARVVAQVLHERDVPFDRKLFFSQDINPIGMASRHGIKTKKMPDNWVRSPEPNPHQKELTRLKGKVRELESQEPELEFSVSFGAPQPFQHFGIEALNAREKEDLGHSILQENRRVSQGGGGMSVLPLSIDSSYDEKYDHWVKDIVPRFVERVQDDISGMYAQSEITIEVKNVGHIQAEGLMFRVDVENGTISKKWTVVPNYPHPPRPQPYSPLHHGFHQTLRDVFHQPVGRHEVAFAIAADGGEAFEVHCQDFRHGGTWVFDGVLTADHHSNEEVRLSVTATASNMRGSKRKGCDFQHELTTVNISHVYDTTKKQFLINRPMEAEIERAAAAKDFSRLSMIKYDD